VIGVISPSRLKLFTGTEEGDGPFFKGTPADEAGFRYGDVIVAMSDPRTRARLPILPDDPFFPGQGQRRFHRVLAPPCRFWRARRSGARRTNGRAGKPPMFVTLSVKPMFRNDLGVRMQMGPIQVIRVGSSAEGKIRVANARSNWKPNMIEAVTVKEADAPRRLQR